MDNIVDNLIGETESEITDENETTDNFGGSNNNSNDNKIDSTTENIPSSSAHKLVFDWDGDFYYVYCMNDTKRQVLVGAVTDKLKPNTEYQVKWALDPYLLTDTAAYFAEDTYNGKATYKIFFDVAYEENTTMYSQGYYQDNVSAILSNKITFTSASEGDLFFIGLFCLDYVTQEDLDYNIDLVFDYIKYIEITEVIE